MGSHDSGVDDHRDVSPTVAFDVDIVVNNLLPGIRIRDDLVSDLRVDDGKLSSLSHRVHRSFIHTPSRPWYC